jgi:hypothetical protein
MKAVNIAKALSVIMFLFGITLLIIAYFLKGNIDWMNTYSTCAFWGLLFTLLGPITLISGDTK